MADTKNNITIAKLNEATFISFSQEETEELSAFNIRTDAGRTWLDFVNPTLSLTLTESRTLKVFATPSLRITHFRIRFAWDGANPPSFLPQPADPSVEFVPSDPTGGKVVVAQIPIPTIPHAWYIWDTIGGYIPGFNLKIQVKRKA
jgi:hypothetical protein